MSVKALMYLACALASAGVMTEPVAAAAAGLNQLETWGKPQGTSATVSNMRCEGTPGSGGDTSTTTVFVIGGSGSNLRPPQNLTMDNPSDNAATGQCRFADTTVVKAIHALCVSADGREFPASHMTPNTWINSGYDGEIARCLPGSVLKVMVGSVTMSDQGLAVSLNDARVLSCGPGMAVRHIKGGALDCAAGQPVAHGTERTNLRKWGTGDMFFTYVTRVCLGLKRSISP
jgi:hypothetical protein